MTVQIRQGRFTFDQWMRRNLQDQRNGYGAMPRGVTYAQEWDRMNRQPKGTTPEVTDAQMRQWNAEVDLLTGALTAKL